MFHPPDAGDWGWALNNCGIYAPAERPQTRRDLRIELQHLWQAYQQTGTRASSAALRAHDALIADGHNRLDPVPPGHMHAALQRLTLETC